MAIPSGILCKAIASESVIPSFKLLVVVKKVVIPSGILWRMRVIKEKIPNLYNFEFVVFLFRIESIINEEITPIKKKSPTNKKEEILGFLEIKRKDSGRREKSEIVIITPAEKLRENDITFSWYFSEM